MNREKIVKAAKSYLGTHEGSAAHSDIIHIFNTVKPDGYTATIKDAWCAEFASAMAIQAYGKQTAKDYFPLSASVPRIVKKAKQMHIWKEEDYYRPSAGDFVIYDWSDSGKGDNKGDPDHIGIVEMVSEKLFTVIEGNYQDKVKRRTLWIDGKYIRGFVTPKYTDTKKSKTEVVKDVLSGKYGNGEERKQKIKAAGYDYVIIQREVTRITYLTKATLSGVYGTGETRKKKLGSDYNIVQWNINRLIKEKEN